MVCYLIHCVELTAVRIEGEGSRNSAGYDLPQLPVASIDMKDMNLVATASDVYETG